MGLVCVDALSQVSQVCVLNCYGAGGWLVSEVTTVFKAQQDQGQQYDGYAGDKGEQDEPGALALSHCLLHQLLYLNLLQRNTCLSARLQCEAVLFQCVMYTKLSAALTTCLTSHAVWYAPQGCKFD